MRAAQPEPLPLDVSGEPRPRPEDALSLAELGLDLRVTQPDPAWLSRRACTPTSLHPELTSEAAEYAAAHGGRWVVGVTRDDEHKHDGWHYPKRGQGRESFAEDVRAAKAECLACPVMTQCRASAVYVTDTSGVAGGWTEGQRDTYRAHHGIPAPDDGLDRTDPDGLSLAVLAQVAELTAMGVEAGRIADHFDSPEIDDTTVEYARQIIAGTKLPKWVAA